jgi:hypothetical protein
MAGVGINLDKGKKQHEEAMAMDSAILVELRTYNTILRAQAQRIARTPFFDTDSIGVGYDGYLYSKYHKFYKVKNDE